MWKWLSDIPRQGVKVQLLETLKVGLSAVYLSV